MDSKKEKQEAKVKKRQHIERSTQTGSDIMEVVSRITPVGVDTATYLNGL